MTEVRTEGRTDGRTDERTDGRTQLVTLIHVLLIREKNGTEVVTLPGARHYKTSNRTGLPGVSIL